MEHHLAGGCVRTLNLLEAHYIDATGALMLAGLLERHPRLTKSTNLMSSLVIGAGARDAERRHAQFPLRHNASSNEPTEGTVTRNSPWPDKVMALLRAGNPAAAIAQIRVAPSVRELRALEVALAAAHLQGKWRDVDAALSQSLQALSAPRLHRSP
jgi:hypothetical protein